MRGSRPQSALRRLYSSSGWMGVPHQTPGRTILPGSTPACEPMTAPDEHARVVAEADLPADDRVRLDDGAARDAGLRRDDDALADLDVVADLHEVVYLRTAPDARLAQRAAVDARVRADLHVVLDRRPCPTCGNLW